MEAAQKKLKLIQKIIACEDLSTLEKLGEFLEQEEHLALEEQADQQASEIYGEDLHTLQDKLRDEINKRMNPD